MWLSNDQIFLNLEKSGVRYEYKRDKDEYDTHDSITLVVYFNIIGPKKYVEASLQGCWNNLQRDLTLLNQEIQKLLQEK